MSFGPYESYRDSGVEWIGNVPAGWTVCALGYRYEVALGKMLDEKQITGTYLAPYLRNVDVQWDRINADDLPMMDFAGEDIARFSLKAGDLLVCEGGEVGRAAIWRGQLTECFYQKALHRLRALEGRREEPRFFYYVLSAAVASQAFAEGVGKATIAHLPAERFRHYKFPFPSRGEQSSIAALLDRETAKIDALVEAQQRLIELLKEKRQAVISHAVTKGLDPDAPMKDSGVEWLGEVPAHWRVTPIRKAARLESGHTPSRSRPDWWQNCTIPWFSLADVWQIREAKSDYVFDTKEKVSELGLANSSARLLPPNTVILSRTASVGYSAIMGVAMATTQDFANWVCGEGLTPEFLLQVLRGMAGEFRRLMMGSTHNTIYMPDIQSLTLALPPVAEQNRLVAHVRQFVTRYDELTNEAEEAIKLLRERRAAIISAAVTGKLDVRGWSTTDVRKTVAAEIIYLNARNPTFGRVKNQKLLYLAQAFAGVEEIAGRYERQAAGPYDGDLIEFIERELEADGVMTVSQAGGRRGMVSYSVPSSRRPDHERLKAMLGDRLGAFEHLNAKLADLDTKGAEAVATLYAVWNDALIDGEVCDDARVIRGFLDEWHPEKRTKFKGADLETWLGWMRRNCIVPKGKGPRTIKSLFG